MTALGFVVAVLPKGPWLLILLLFVAAGSLGFFPNYYAFSQDLTRRHQGKVIGVLSCITWVASAFMQMSVGAYLEENQSYQLAITLAAAAPLIALAALLLFWRPTRSV
jgi:ACS family hexuronate transporter-like MFS transporter